jgi:hypothetical protein
MRAKWNAYRLLVGKSEGKRPLGRPKVRWVNNIRIGLGEEGWGYVDWIGLPQDRAVVNAVMNLRVPTGGLSSSAQLHRSDGRGVIPSTQRY